MKKEETTIFNKVLEIKKKKRIDLIASISIAFLGILAELGGLIYFLATDIKSFMVPFLSYSIVALLFVVLVYIHYRNGLF